MKQMPRIKMMGIGHGGNHMLDYVMNQSIRNVEYITWQMKRPCCSRAQKGAYS